MKRSCRRRHPRQAVGEPDVDVHRPRILVEADQGSHVVGYAMLADRFGVLLRDAHHRLPEGALAAVLLEPEVDLSAICVLICRAWSPLHTPRPMRAAATLWIWRAISFPFVPQTLIPWYPMKSRRLSPIGTTRASSRLLERMRWLLMCASAMRAAEPEGTSISTNCLCGGVEERSCHDDERRASVPHLVEFLHLRELAQRQEALGEHRMGVRHVVAPRHHAGDDLEQSVFGRPHDSSPSAQSEGIENE